MKLIKSKKKLSKALSICLSVLIVFSSTSNIVLAEKTIGKTIFSLFGTDEMGSGYEILNSDDNDKTLERKNRTAPEPNLDLIEQNKKIAVSGYRSVTDEFSLMQDGELEYSVEASGAPSSGGSSGGGSSNVVFEGEGTESSPYLVSNAIELAAIGRYEEKKYFKLTQNITLEPFEEQTDSWSPIPSFCGVLDGNEKTISDLQMEADYSPFLNSDENNFGFIRTIEAGAEVKNLTLKDVNISGGANVGALAGVLYGSVTNCNVSGAINSLSGVGGLVGIALDGSSITNCTSSASITGEYFLGGLIGIAEGSTIKSSKSTGSVTPVVNHNTGYIGGFAGVLEDTNVDNCTSSGNVSVVNENDEALDGYNYVGNVGGFAGYIGLSNISVREFGVLEVPQEVTNYTIKNCSSTGNVASIINNVGGFAGLVGNYSRSNSITLSIDNCTSSGNITVHGYNVDYDYYSYSAVENIGGFIGTLNYCESIANCTALGKNITGTYIYNENVGGFIGMTGYYGVASLGFEEEIKKTLVENCGATYDIATNSSYFVGGFIGNSRSSTFDACYAKGSVTTKEYAQSVGGFVGENVYSTYINCSAKGNVVAEKSGMSIGGFIGTDRGYSLRSLINEISVDEQPLKTSFVDCNSTGNVTVSIDYKKYDVKSDFTPLKAYDGASFIGGFAGTIEGDNYLFSNCYSNNEILINELSDYSLDEKINNIAIGGFIGSIRSQNFSIDSCYFEGSLTCDAFAQGIGGFIGVGVCHNYYYYNDDEDDNEQDDNTNGFITNCYSVGNVTSEGAFVGGFAGGLLNISVTDCYTIGDVKGSMGVSGFIGLSELASFTNCHAQSNINGGYYSGGFVGVGGECRFEQCSVTGTLEVETKNIYEKGYTEIGYGPGLFGVGGFVGLDFSNLIENCYTNCDIDATITEEILMCVEEQELSDNVGVGGFSGHSDVTTISNSYSAGKITVNNDESISLTGFAPFANVADNWRLLENIEPDVSVFTNCFYDSEIVGEDIDNSVEIDGVTGKTTESMKNKRTFTKADWDFNNVWELNNSYPYFIKIAVTGTVYSNSGNPVVNAVLNVNDIMTTTDSNGEYIISLHKGYYMFKVLLDDKKHTIMRLIQDSTAKNIDLDIKFISGTVRGITAGDVVNVTLKKENTIIATKEITSRGTSAAYQFNDVQSGRYTVETTCKGYKRNSISVNITSSDSIGNHINLTKEASNQGTKYRSLDNNYTIVNSVIVPVKRFVDINENYSWANSSIEFLTQKGVINGTSDTTYSPGSSITRADFIVLLTRCLSLKGTVNNNFSDVPNDAYFYNEIGIAKQLGIANGTENGEFNPSREISREEMMVLTVRALNAAGITLEAINNADMLSQYTDLVDVEEYAKNDVTTLILNGLIQGNGSSVFPKQNLTRAEAAVLILRIMQAAKLI